MTSGTVMRMSSSREEVCGNNAVQFLSCDGSSYCTALGENGFPDSFPPIVRFSYGQMMIREISEGRIIVHDEDRSGRPSLVTPELMEIVQVISIISFIHVYMLGLCIYSI